MIKTDRFLLFLESGCMFPYSKKNIALRNIFINSGKHTDAYQLTMDYFPEFVELPRDLHLK